MLFQENLVALRQQQDGWLADLGHVPSVSLRLHHAADLRDRLGIGLNADHLDAGLFSEGPVETRTIGRGVNAPVIAHDNALGLRAGVIQDSWGADRRQPDSGDSQRIAA